MTYLNRPGRRRKRIFLPAFLLLVLVATALYFFVQSPSFVRLVERIATAGAGETVTIGSISLEPGQVVSIKGITVGKDMTVEAIEASLGLGGLLSGRVERLFVKRPVISIRPEGTGGSRPVSIPDFYNELQVEGAVLKIKGPKKSFVAGPADLLITRTTGTMAKVRSKVFFRPLDATLSFEFTLDTSDLAIDGGHIDTGTLRLEDIATAAGGKAFVKRGLMKGTMKTSVDIKKTAGGLGVELRGLLSDISLFGPGRKTGGLLTVSVVVPEDFRSFDLDARLIFKTPSGWGASLNGAYDRKRDFFLIRSAALDSPRGRILMAGTIAGLRKGPRAAVTLKAEGLSPGKILELAGRREDVSGTVDLEAEISGPLSGPFLIKAGLAARALYIKRDRLALDLGERKVDLMFKGLYDIKRDLLEIKSLRVGSGKGASFFMKATVDGFLGGKGRLAVKGHLKNLRAGEIKGAVKGIIPSYLATAGGEIDGDFKVKGILTPGVFKGMASFTLKKGSFSTADGLYAAEGINVSARAGFNIGPAAAAFDVKTRAAGMELLMGAFYANLTKRHVDVSLKGIYDGAVRIERAALFLSGVGSLSLKGEIEGLKKRPRFNIKLAVEKISNKPAYDLFARENFAELYPFLSDLDVGGTTSANFSATGTPEGFTVKGELVLKDVNVVRKNFSIIEGMDLKLPVGISRPEAGKAEGPGFGSLGIEKISAGPVVIEDIRAEPVIRANTLLFKAPLRLPVFGGTVTVRDLSITDILGSRRALTASMDIRDVDLEEASLVFGLPAFSGSLTGTIPEVTVHGGRLATKGEVKLKVFGGDVRIRAISVENIMSPAASFRSSVEIKDIDLARMTETFEFGRITGVVEGYVRDLVIVKGQPEAFTAHLETVRRKGVRQRISTTALEKISILGTGRRASVLRRGIYRLFSEYRYSKMGFSARLRNDRLILLGVETVGGKGYIIKGGLLPPKVDVISYTRSISFGEMMKRIKRISRIKAGGEDGP